MTRSGDRFGARSRKSDRMAGFIALQSVNTS